MPESLMLAVDGGEGGEGPYFAAIDLTPELIERLWRRADQFRRCLEIYPELYEAYEFDYSCGFYGPYDSYATDHEDDPEAQRKMDGVKAAADGSGDPAALPPGVDSDDIGELIEGSLDCLVVPGDFLPAYGNVRVECSQLVLSLARFGEPHGPVEFRWLCYLKNTDVELRTRGFSSAELADIVKIPEPVSS